ncbi:hypothetical protein CEQ31_020295 [Serratia odorifera]|nr:hypothetical protein CEQ31_020295 [Serratia odorifera]
MQLEIHWVSPWFSRAASLLAAHANPGHLVRPSSPGFLCLPPRCNSKSIGYPPGFLELPRCCLYTRTLVTWYGQAPRASYACRLDATRNPLGIPLVFSSCLVVVCTREPWSRGTAKLPGLLMLAA